MASRHNYGDDPSQYGVLYGEGPVAVLIHGGFWKAEYDLDADGRAGATTSRARGWAAWNIEYRRLGNGGGVPDTLDDVSAAIDHLATLPTSTSRRVVDDRPLRGRPPRGVGRDARSIRAWRSPASCPRRACWTCSARAELRLSDGVVDRFLGGPADATVASPIERLPLGVPALLTHGGRDDIVPVEISAALRRARPARR